MSLGYLVSAGALAIALMLGGQWLWFRRLYAYAVLTTVGSAVAVFCFVAGGLLGIVGVPR
ncbi:hypothetical protein ACFYOK_29560 [Microbispora bryophytorum]|uniref:hypothetical protein n=1 Tax=Microbispora bryophytorum TaxID=1460882 RepID=UPI003407DEDF